MTQTIDSNRILYILHNINDYHLHFLLTPGSQALKKSLLLPSFLLSYTDFLLFQILSSKPVSPILTFFPTSPIPRVYNLSCLAATLTLPILPFKP